MISSVAGLYGFAGEAFYCAAKFAQVGFAQALDRELRPHGIKVVIICPGDVKTEFALGKIRTEQSLAKSGMLEWRLLSVQWFWHAPNRPGRVSWKYRCVQWMNPWLSDVCSFYERI